MENENEKGNRGKKKEKKNIENRLVVKRAQ